MFNPEPTQTTANLGPGVKFDKAKPDYSLLNYPWLESTIRVLMYGAERYGRFNWQHLENALERCSSAVMRHTAAILQGELYDKETGLPHAAHIAAESMFLDYFTRKNQADIQHILHKDEYSMDEIEAQR